MLKWCMHGFYKLPLFHCCRVFWRQLAEEAIRLQRFTELTSTEIWMQMVSMSDALACLRGASGTAPEEEGWQTRSNASCLAKGCNGEANNRAVLQEFLHPDQQPSRMEDFIPLGDAPCSILPLGAAKYASTTEYGLLESCFKIG